MSNLQFKVKEQELMDYFNQNDCNPVRAKLLFDNDGNSKGTGFVELKTADNAIEASKKLNNEYFQGRKLVVNVAN